MFIATNGIPDNAPEDVRELSERLLNGGDGVDRGETQGLRANTPLPNDPDRGETGAGAQSKSAEAPASTSIILDRWDVQSHQYLTKADVSTGILGGIFSAKGQVSNCGVVQEAKKYYLHTTNAGRQVQFGTAVRLSVAVFDADLGVALTLPNIAAKAQLANVTARIALSVAGYTGPLGDLLPAPDNLNVENLTVYTSAFKAIQAQVFGTAGLAYLKPTFLGYDETRPADKG